MNNYTNITKKPGIYKIVNKVNGKFYIGSAVNLRNRRHSHYNELRHNKHNNKHLQRAWNKYGEKNFEFIVIEIIEDKFKIREREDYYLKSTKCCDEKYGYNILETSNIGLGVSANKEVRAKISKACKGSKNGNYGRKHTEEELDKMYLIRWGINRHHPLVKLKQFLDSTRYKSSKQLTKNTLRKLKNCNKILDKIIKLQLKYNLLVRKYYISYCKQLINNLYNDLYNDLTDLSNMLYKHSKELKQVNKAILASSLKKPKISKLSEAVKKKKSITEEGRQRLREYALGRKLSEETRKKISEKAKGRKHSLEAIQKMKLTRKGEDNANSKITKEQALEIFDKLNKGVHYKVLIKEYNVCSNVIYRIKKKDYWVFKNNG